MCLNFTFQERSKVLANMYLSHGFKFLTFVFTLVSATRYMQRLVGELSPAAGLNFSDGYQATAVVKAVANGGTFLTYGKKLPQHIVFEEDGRKRVEWTAFLKEKNLKLKALGM